MFLYMMAPVVISKVVSPLYLGGHVTLALILPRLYPRTPRGRRLNEANPYFSEFARASPWARRQKISCTSDVSARLARDGMQAFLLMCFVAHTYDSLCTIYRRCLAKLQAKTGKDAHFIMRRRRQVPTQMRQRRCKEGHHADRYHKHARNPT